MRLHGIGLRLILLGAALVAVILPSNAAEEPPVVGKTRALYYNVKSQNVADFRCEVKPGWEQVLTNGGADQAGIEKIRPYLDDVAIQVVVGANGMPSVSHHQTLTPPNDQVASGLKTMIGSAEQAVSGFFIMWSQFMYGTFLPAKGSVFQVQDSNGETVITQKQGDVIGIVTLTPDLSVIDLHVTSPMTDMVLRPRFADKDGKKIVTGWGSRLDMPAGRMDTDTRLESLPVDGIELPSAFWVVVGSNETSYHLTNCSVRKSSPAAARKRTP